jgi:enamine deaminase RidA (YjgF/YER057c/UK114 family)
LSLPVGEPGGSAVGAEVARLPGDPPSPYEGRYGFSRVVRAGPFVLVGGTTSVRPDGSIVGETPYEQTAEILRKLVHELGRAGATPAEVIQTMCYVTDISRADEVGRAHSEVFGAIRPLMTMVEVSALIDPRMLVEIEATAYLGTGS